MEYKTPSNLKYTKDHEWALFEENTVTIGITDYAQSSLGEIVFVELPEIGQVIEIGSSFGVIESIKSVSDLYCPISGKVLEINNLLLEQPDLLNSNPYENWIIKLALSSTDEENSLLSDDQYKKICD